MAAPLPGPYAYTEDGTLEHVQSGLEIASLARIEDFRPDFQQELDATGHLLSAAPDLLSELKRMVAAAEGFITAFRVDPNFTTLIPCTEDEIGKTATVAALLIDARAAISKAEGR